MMEPFDPSEGLLTAAETAALMGVDHKTVLTWARNYEAQNDGPSIPARRTPGGQWRFSRAWVRERRGG